ncbi:MAG: response regulator [Endomicrobiales bacterium]|jgi:DNA-binding response OmpR family regulator
MKKKIMIIDDDKELLDELAALLVSNGYEVTAISNGKAGLEMIPKVLPDLLLLDLKMDGMSGFRVADKINCSSDAKTIPIIAMSGHYSPEEYSLILKICGIKRCITKPFSPEMILNEVKNALSKDTVSSCNI